MSELINVVNNFDVSDSSKMTWVIEDLSIEDRNDGDYLSMEFKPINISGNCRLLLYPRNKKNKDKDFLFLYLAIYTCLLPPKITIHILNSQGASILINHASMTLLYTSNSRAIFTTELRNHILYDNKIKILCSFGESQSDSEKNMIRKTIIIEKSSSVEQLDDVSEYLPLRFAEIDKFEALINEDEFSDISLISESKTIKAHKCILAKSSSVFASMFRTDMEEKRENKVEIPDIKYDVLLEMIRFIYTGKVNGIDTIATELVGVADKYEIEGLKEMCWKAMYKNLSIDNSLLCLVLADRYRMDGLKEKIIAYIVAYAKDITNQPEFKLLSSDLMSEICCALVRLM